MLAPGAMASRVRGRAVGKQARSTYAQQTVFPNDIRQYMSYKIGDILPRHHEPVKRFSFPKNRPLPFQWHGICLFALSSAHSALSGTPGTASNPPNGMKRPVEKLPDPWLFDSEKLLRELARCRELVLNVPINDTQATHFALNIAINAIWDLEQQLRYLLHLHREGQRLFSRKAEQPSAGVPANTGTLAQPMPHRGGTGRPRKTSAVA